VKQEEQEISKYTGQCLCGLIQYSVDKIQPKMAHCHCSMCRKFHGAAFSTFGEAKKEHFHWTQGQEYLKSYQAENGTIRQFCGNCGSSLIFKPANDQGEVVEFALATLEPNDANEALKPDAHVFVDSKVNWIKILDDLPQFAKARGVIG